ncbi:MAG: hypothetical protein MUF24_10655 [Chitinophagaceae bacterium]|nr:hypothetical protein [Chitinophagaceae bacterium]
MIYRTIIALIAVGFLAPACEQPGATQPSFSLSTEKDTLFFNNFVDCNMAEAWIGDTFRIFPGKYGHDTLWGNARDLKFASGLTPAEAFGSDTVDFTEPALPEIAPVGSTTGLHGAVWFETVYQDKNDASGRTLYALYHNENYAANLPYNPATGQGYLNKNWPQGLQGPTSPAAVCRIGIMKSTDGGRSWQNKGLLLEDLQPRLILKPHNTSNTFAGGVGDPSAVANGDYLYVFYGEYGYPGQYDSATYKPLDEHAGQCISIARIALKDLDSPTGKAYRWDGKAFAAPWNGVGRPVQSLQIAPEKGGGPASSPGGGFYWGPSVSWNEYLQCWVMLMGKVTGPSWAGSSIHLSFNPNKDLAAGNNAQQWSTPQLLLDRPGYFLWYPSLQPLGTPDDVQQRYTCTRLGKKARLYVKYIKPERSIYASAHTIEFEK